MADIQGAIVSRWQIGSFFIFVPRRILFRIGTGAIASNPTIIFVPRRTMSGNPLLEEAVPRIGQGSFFSCTWSTFTLWLGSIDVVLTDGNIRT